MQTMFASGQSRSVHWAIAGSAPARAKGDPRGQAALGIFGKSVIHDLRNPLAAIQSGAEILTAKRLPKWQIKRVARNMYDASLRIQEMLQDYADPCRTRENQLRPSDLRGLVTHVVDRIARLAQAQSVEVVQDVPADLAVVMDRGRIGSVLANLLTNALDAMPAGGSVRVSAITTESSVVIRVLDNGSGIAPEIRGSLFQPFVTARKTNGWGLGLAHARQIVIDHGGELWLEAPPGRGARLLSACQRPP